MYHVSRPGKAKHSQAAWRMCPDEFGCRDVCSAPLFSWLHACLRSPCSDVLSLSSPFSLPALSVLFVLRGSASCGCCQVGMDWKLGVALASSECASLMSPFVALTFTVNDANGAPRTATVELSYKELQVMPRACLAQRAGQNWRRGKCVPVLLWMIAPFRLICFVFGRVAVALALPRRACPGPSPKLPRSLTASRLPGWMRQLRQSSRDQSDRASLRGIARFLRVRFSKRRRPLDCFPEPQSRVPKARQPSKRKGYPTRPYREAAGAT